MNLSSLRVLHLPKRASRSAVDACGTVDAARLRQSRGFTLETCQRRIVVMLAESDEILLQGEGEWLQGAAAYCFLLELASGLKSALVGESEILAQLKSAWSDLERSGGEFVAELRPWIQVILADAKEVREQYLRGTGGQSYGSLLRHELGEARDRSILVVGAGKLAFGVLPYLTGDRIRIWNRTPSNAEALRERLQSRLAAPIGVVAPALEAELAAWAEASLVVLCVPPDPDRDGARVASVMRRAPGDSPRVAHLGLLEAGNTIWGALDSPITLESLFTLDRRQAALRTQRVALAHRWCESRSRLRALDRCVSIAHGWEDLAGFVTTGAA